MVNSSTDPNDCVMTSVGTFPFLSTLYYHRVPVMHCATMYYFHHGMKGFILIFTFVFFNLSDMSMFACCLRMSPRVFKSKLKTNSKFDLHLQNG